MIGDYREQSTWHIRSLRKTGYMSIFCAICYRRIFPSSSFQFDFRFYFLLRNDLPKFVY
jgi:hypothetical protein